MLGRLKWENLIFWDSARMVMHYFPKSWWEIICSHILSDGQSVMNPACSFDVIHSTRILCTSKTFFIFAKRNCQTLLEKDLISSWGLFEKASDTMVISFLFAPLDSALQSWKGQYLKKNIARGTTDPGYWVYNLNYLLDLNWICSYSSNILVIQVLDSICWVCCAMFSMYNIPVLHLH